MTETKNIRHMTYIPWVGFVTLPDTPRIEYLMQHKPIVPEEYTKLKMVLLTALVFVVALVIGTVIGYYNYWNYWVERHTIPGFFGAIYNTHDQIKSVFDIAFSYNHWEFFIKSAGFPGGRNEQDWSWIFGLWSIFGMGFFWFVRDLRISACRDRLFEWSCAVYDECCKPTQPSKSKRKWTVVSTVR